MGLQIQVSQLKYIKYTKGSRYCNARNCLIPLKYQVLPHGRRVAYKKKTLVEFVWCHSMSSS